jgi:RNA polymerase sigma-70 factor, ECF subfamily
VCQKSIAAHRISGEPAVDELCYRIIRGTRARLGRHPASNHANTAPRGTSTVNETSPHASDIALASACAAADPAAIATLDALLVDAIRRAVRRIDPSPEFADAVAQELRTRLLVGNRPRIREYQGRSSLRSWLTTAAVRTALNLRRGQANRSHDSVGSGIRALGGEPEMTLLRARARSELAAAVQAGIARLTARDRAILRLSVVDGLGLEQLGALYHVGKSTAGRWLQSARASFRALVRAELCERLALDDDELASYGRALDGEIEVSLARMLLDEPRPPR